MTEKQAWLNLPWLDVRCGWRHVATYEHCSRSTTWKLMQTNKLGTINKSMTTISIRTIWNSRAIDPVKPMTWNKQGKAGAGAAPRRNDEKGDREWEYAGPRSKDESRWNERCGATTTHYNTKPRHNDKMNNSGTSGELWRGMIPLWGWGCGPKPVDDEELW